MNDILMFGYAGPIIATIAFNAIGALVVTICVYIYLNRNTLKRNSFLYHLTKPLHGFIRKTAKNKLKKTKK